MPSILRRDYKKIPESPGCYLYKSKEGEVLYVGKAKNLRKRVASYFTKKDLDPKTTILVGHIYEIDYFATKNEVEALILENNLIKKHYPKYNIDLKDSRRYAYLRLADGEEIPYIEVARTREEKGQYFGPFVNGRYRREIVKVIERYFKILTRKPSLLRKKSIDLVEYNARLKMVVSLLKGKVKELISELEGKMSEASVKKNYEYAMTLRNQIDALESMKERQHMELRRNYDADIISYVRSGDSVYLMLFNIYKGVLENKQEFEFSFSDNLLEEFLVRYYSSHPVPGEIIIPEKMDSSMDEYLCRVRGKKVILNFPSRGVKLELLKLAEKNIKMALEGNMSRVFDLQKILGLEIVPNRIECFDISHLRGKNTVASMVKFVDGNSVKSQYRKFKIQADTGGDDILAMKEVVRRRYGGSLRETMTMPDLIVIDGGRAQLNAALGELSKLGLKIPVISLAKRLEEIYLPERKETLLVSHKRIGLQLLQAMRDEAHRFAISYNRRLRSRGIVGKRK